MSLEAQVVIQGTGIIGSAPARCERDGAAYSRFLAYGGYALNVVSGLLGLPRWTNYYVCHAELFDEISESIDGDYDEGEEDDEEAIWALVLAKAPYHDSAGGLAHARAILAHLEQNEDDQPAELEQLGYRNLVQDLQAVVAILEDAMGAGRGFHVAVD